MYNLPLHFLHKITTQDHSANADPQYNDTVAECQASVASPHIFSSNLSQKTGFHEVPSLRNEYSQNTICFQGLHNDNLTFNPWAGLP